MSHANTGGPGTIGLAGCDLLSKLCEVLPIRLTPLENFGLARVHDGDFRVAGGKSGLGISRFRRHCVLKAVDSLPHAIEAIAQYDSTVEMRLGKIRVDLESPVIARQGLFKAAEFQASEAPAVQCGRKIGVDRRSPAAGRGCLPVGAG